MAYWDKFKPETKFLMVQAGSGLNIYAMLNRLKAIRKENIYLPESVVVAVCKSYIKNRATIKNPWAWFQKAVTMEGRKQRIADTIKENDSHNREPPAPAVKSLISDCFAKRVDIFP